MPKTRPKNDLIIALSQLPGRTIILNFKDLLSILTFYFYFLCFFIDFKRAIYNKIPYYIFKDKKFNFYDFKYFRFLVHDFLKIDLIYLYFKNCK